MNLMTFSSIFWYIVGSIWFLSASLYRNSYHQIRIHLIAIVIPYLLVACMTIEYFFNVDRISLFSDNFFSRAYYQGFTVFPDNGYGNGGNLNCVN